MNRLRALPGILHTPPLENRHPFAPFEQGIPRGAITELIGEPGLGKTELVTRFLAENPKLRVAWIEERLSVYPRALPARGVDLSRVMFIEAQEHLAWTAIQALQSEAFQCVLLAPSNSLSAVQLRRIQLAAEKAQAFVFLLSERAVRLGRWTIRRSMDCTKRRSK